MTKTNLAIFATGGKQYLVSPKDVIQVEKLEGAAGDVVRFETVMLSAKDGAVTAGAPLVSGGVVTAKILRQARSKKILVFKYKAKSKYRRKQGHRQEYTELEIATV